MERDFFADFLGVLERDLLDRLGVRGEGDLRKDNIFQFVLHLKLKERGIQMGQTHLLDDFLLLDRGESLCEEREGASLE